MKRRVLLQTDAPCANEREIVDIITYYVTHGDPAEYYNRMAEKQKVKTMDMNKKKEV